MVVADLDGVARVARLAFPDHFEARSCFAERQRLYPRACFTLAGARHGVEGYLIAYPWISGSVPPLNSLIHALPARADLLYLHDLALHPDARGRGLTRPIVDRLVDQARTDGWGEIALVAVNRATEFWTNMGFRVVEDRQVAEKLASYGDGARYMIRHI